MAIFFPPLDVVIKWRFAQECCEGRKRDYRLEYSLRKGRWIIEEHKRDAAAIIGWVIIWCWCAKNRQMRTKNRAMVVMFGGAGSSSSVNPNINRFEERLREKIRGEFLITWIMNEWFPLPLRFVLESAMRTKTTTTTTRWSHNEVSV